MGREIDPISLKTSGNGNILLTGFEAMNDFPKSFKVKNIEECTLGELRTTDSLISEADKAAIYNFDLNASSLIVYPKPMKITISCAQAEEQKRKELKQIDEINDNLTVVERSVFKNSEDTATLVEILSFTYTGKDDAIRDVHNFQPETISYKQKTNNIVVSGFRFDVEKLESEYRSYNIENIRSLTVSEISKDLVLIPLDPRVIKRRRSRRISKVTVFSWVLFIGAALVGFFGSVLDDFL